MFGTAWALLAGVAIVRICGTYPHFTQTWDEPVHVAAGLEWLQTGSYELDPLHPPLARIAFAALPALLGRRLDHVDTTMWVRGNNVLHAGGEYQRTLTAARLGNLPFFVAAAAAVVMLGMQLGGRLTATAALLVFTNTPSILAHGGLATTDMALTAGMLWSVYGFWRWWSDPSPALTVLLGLSVGATVLCKLSAFVFLPAAFLGAAIGMSVLPTTRLAHRGRALPRARSIVGVCAIAALVIWAGYRFDMGAAITPSQAASAAGAPLSPVGRGVVRALASPAFPAPALAQGLGELVNHQSTGERKSFLLGRGYRGGRWEFFPIGLGVKLPLAFMVLFLIGVGGILSGGVHQRVVVPLAAATGMLLTAMGTNLNIGTRHLLPVVGLVSVIAGAGAMRWISFGKWRVPVTVTLIATALVSTARVHPDYVSYFNVLVRVLPAPALIASDLDWGQDLGRLTEWASEHGISEIWLAYYGSADLPRHHPGFRRLPSYEQRHGWVAASTYSIYLGKVGYLSMDDFAWLRSYEPVAKIGTSIFVYRIPREIGPADNAQ